MTVRVVFVLFQRFIIELSQAPEPSQILRLFVVHSALLLSSVYSARILQISLRTIIALCTLLHQIIVNRHRLSMFRDASSNRSLHTPTETVWACSLGTRPVVMDYTYSCCYMLYSLTTCNGWHSALYHTSKMAMFLQYNRRTLF